MVLALQANSPVRLRETDKDITPRIHHYFRLLLFFPPVFLLLGLPVDVIDSLSLRFALPLSGEDGTVSFADVDGVAGDVGAVSGFGVGEPAPYLASVSW